MTCAPWPGARAGLMGAAGAGKAAVRERAVAAAEVEAVRLHPKATHNTVKAQPWTKVLREVPFGIEPRTVL